MTAGVALRTGLGLVALLLALAGVGAGLVLAFVLPGWWKTAGVLVIFVAWLAALRISAGGPWP